jgi:hypothetical protein
LKSYLPNDLPSKKVSTVEKFDLGIEIEYKDSPNNFKKKLEDLLDE